MKTSVRIVERYNDQIFRQKTLGIHQSNASQPLSIYQKSIAIPVEICMMYIVKRWQTIQNRSTHTLDTQNSVTYTADSLSTVVSKKGSNP